MSGHSPIRQDKTCLNCRHVVERRYCPNCGQENTDSRKTFHHLFIHFFEDLTHYENAFWKTIRHLLFKPGRLTQEYLSGKRLSYLAPVRLYIFISFVTFFIISMLPSHGEDQESEYGEKAGLVKVKRELKFDKPADSTTALLVKRGDSLIQIPKTAAEVQSYLHDLDSIEKKPDTNKRSSGNLGKYKTVRELDSVQNRLAPSEKLSKMRYGVEKFLAKVHEKTDEEDFEQKFTESFIHNIPKALFLYMPIFAFWLWVFHGKKRWYYFDHGIFTLHYFSFMLLTLCTMLVFTALMDWIAIDFITDFINLLWIVLCGWWFFYFFRSHSRFYGETKTISRLKSIALYFINMWLITFFTMGLLAYTILYMH